MTSQIVKVRVELLEKKLDGFLNWGEELKLARIWREEMVGDDFKESIFKKIFSILYREWNLPDDILHFIRMQQKHYNKELTLGQLVRIMNDIRNVVKQDVYYKVKVIIDGDEIDFE